jgi:hypothetical protein
MNDMVAASLKGQPSPRRDVPMIVVKHRWMKNRNQSFGVTILSFNDEGIARVADVGNARLDVEGYVQHSKGLAKIVPPAVEVLTVPEPLPPVEKVEEKPVEDDLELLEVEKPPKPRPPQRKKPTTKKKKLPGKKGKK